jgi:hypothetical protein
MNQLWFLAKQLNQGLRGPQTLAYWQIDLAALAQERSSFHNAAALFDETLVILTFSTAKLVVSFIESRG